MAHAQSSRSRSKKVNGSPTVIIWQEIISLHLLWNKCISKNLSDMIILNMKIRWSRVPYPNASIMCLCYGMWWMLNYCICIVECDVPYLVWCDLCCVSSLSQSQIIIYKYLVQGNLNDKLIVAPKAWADRKLWDRKSVV